MSTWRGRELIPRHCRLHIPRPRRPVPRSPGSAGRSARILQYSYRIYEEENIMHENMKKK